MLTISENDLPLDAMTADSALCVIVGTEGPSYRPCGAGMVVHPDKSRVGHLSSGCIDGDIALQAVEALRDGEPRSLRYGRGSPYADLSLPCGGGLDILILPRLDVGTAQHELAARHEAELRLGPVKLRIIPALRILVFGRGAEARIFADVAHAAGYQVELHADEETRKGTTVGKPGSWPETEPDSRTAITLFFHDHDLELTILERALATPAFYIGAMGSERAATYRDAALRDRGISSERLQRPFGLIRSARNPRSLAVSVLADILTAGEFSFAGHL